MKNLLFILILLASLFISCNTTEQDIHKNKTIKNDSTIVKQDTLKNITRLQEFMSKKGLLIVKDAYSVGTLSGKYSIKMKFDVIILYEPGKEKQRIKGLKIEIPKISSYSESSETVFLDVEELESLSNALNYMLNLKELWKEESKEYTEVIFETKGGFSVGFYKQKKVYTAFAKAGHIGAALCPLKKTDDLLKLKNKIDESIKLLKEK